MIPSVEEQYLNRLIESHVKPLRDEIKGLRDEIIKIMDYVVDERQEREV